MAKKAINWNQPQPAPKVLWSWIHANFSQARFEGIYNPRNIAGTNRPSMHAEGRALDIGLSVSTPDEKVFGDQLFKLFIQNSQELGLDHVIWNRQIWSLANRGPRPYTGRDSHTGHIHVAFTREGSQRSTFPHLILDISILRTGLEDLIRGQSTSA
jgi:hypothetical protein